MLKTQLGRQASISSTSPRKFLSQHDARSADVNSITLKNGKVLEEPKGKEKDASELAEKDKQSEPIN